MPGAPIPDYLAILESVYVGLRERSTGVIFVPEATILSTADQKNRGL